jgi:cellulose synthase/poly-beta-1,6-N-acetylglucosamine synthase-like glycosyltransferase
MPSPISSNHHTRKRVAFPYEIAIPSYKRPETLRDKTLMVLKQYRIPANKITVFVANAEQKKLYEATLIPGTYGSLVVGIVGMGAIRNFITSWYPIGTKIVNIDDDIRGFLEYDASRPRKEKPLRSLVSVIKRGFDECEKAGARLWGVYPVANGFFMKPKVSTDLRYIIGSVWGCINPGLKAVKITLDDKEDYQRSILYYKLYGAVVRLNFVAPVSSYYKEPGGMQEERTKQRVEKSARWLVKHYPEFAVLNPSKKSGYMEVRLKDMRETKKPKTDSDE